MDLSKYMCLVCGESRFRAFTTIWQCEGCGQKYPTLNGMPKLYVEDDLGQRDRALRDFLYNGFLGKYYQYIMPFLALPVRPAYWSGWLAYGLSVTAVSAFTAYATYFLCFHGWRTVSPFDGVLLALFVGVTWFLFRQRYLFFLLLLAIPVKIALLFTRFRPQQSFSDVHGRLIDELLQGKKTLAVLDISTGSCNSLFRHGWMRLDAEYTGLDLSETMLLQGLRFMAGKQVPIDLVVGSATRLPFGSDRFDVVLNYGALNGYSDPKRALEEMARVTKKGGLVLFFDEQLHPAASLLERIYFQRVLSNHNLIHHCPVELMPPTLGDVKVHQIYHFYYLCTSYKQ